VYVFFFPAIYEKVERGGGKGVHFGSTFWVLRCFFHCGEAREGLSGGNFFYKVIMGRGVFRVHFDFFFSFVLVLKGGGQFFFSPLDI